MKKYLSKKFQRAKLNFDNFRQKIIVRAWGLAKRLDAKQMKRFKGKNKHK